MVQLLSRSLDGTSNAAEILAMLRSRIESLQQHIERVRSRVSEPYQFLVQRTDQLERLQVQFCIP